jgi:hypothetical protein
MVGSSLASAFGPDVSFNKRWQMLPVRPRRVPLSVPGSTACLLAVRRAANTTRDAVVSAGQRDMNELGASDRHNCSSAEAARITVRINSKSCKFDWRPRHQKSPYRSVGLASSQRPRWQCDACPSGPAAEETPLEEIARLMLRYDIGHIPVVRNRVPVGIVARHDFLRILAEEAKPMRDVPGH